MSKIAEATEAFSFLVLFYYYSHFFFELHIRQDDTKRALQNPPGGSPQLAPSFGGSCPLWDESCHWIIWKAYTWPLQQRHFRGGGESVSNSPPPLHASADGHGSQTGNLASLPPRHLRALGPQMPPALIGNFRPVENRELRKTLSALQMFWSVVTQQCRWRTDREERELLLGNRQRAPFLSRLPRGKGGDFDRMVRNP